jgi:5-formaminoimidazole-4-carboxamide-1-beta-D-ribofuranosyl 5'-monophosphate synthetase
MIICDECVRYEHSDHAGRHISDLKNAEIEKYIVEINADINLWQSKVSGLLEDI